MRIEEEIKEIIDELYEKKGSGEINSEKLLSYFSAIELNYNHELSSYRDHLAEIKRKQREGIVHDSPVKGFSLRLRYLVAPAAAAMVIIISLFTLDLLRRDNGKDEKNEFFAAAKAFSGKVNFLSGDKTGTINSKSKLSEGDLLVTGKTSYADISLGGDVMFRLAEKSRVRFRKISSAGGTKNFNIDLLDGKMLLSIKKLSGRDTINIFSSSSVATVKGTLFSVSVDRKRDSVIEVYEGKVKVRNNLPPGLEKLDVESRRKLEKILEMKAVVVNKGSSCSVKHLEKKLDLRSPETLKRELSLIGSPRISEKKPGEFKTSEIMFSFIKKHEGNVRSEEIRKSMIKLQAVEEKHIHERAVSSGFPLWKKKNRALYLLYAPASGLFLSVNRNGSIEATDLRKIRWSVPLPGKIESRPVVDKRTLFFSTTGNILGAINLSNGKLLWFRRIKGSVPKNVRIITERGSLYAATSGGILYKFTKDGREEWSLAFNDTFETTPVLGKYMIMVSVKGGRIFGVDRNRGIKIIKKKFESRIISMVIHKSNIYVLSDMGNLICYNYLIDEFLWSRNFKSDVLTEMLIDGRSIYIFTGKGTIYKIDGTGKSHWKSSIGNRIARNVIDDREHIYLAVDKAFYVVNKNTGEVKWSVVTPPVISGNIAASGTKVLFVTEKKGLTELKK